MRSLDGVIKEDEDRVRRAYAARRDAVPHDRFSAFNTANLLRIQEVESSLLRMLRKHGVRSVAEKRILDVGCGSGYWILKLLEWGAQAETLTGIDLLQERIENARLRLPSTVELRCANAAHLDFPEHSFDLVCQFTMLTSVLEPRMRAQIASEMLRVLKPGGAILWYDFCVNNPRNPDVKKVSRMEIRALFPGCRLNLDRITVAPPVGRIIGNMSPVMYSMLSGINLFCTHYIGFIEKRA